MSNKLWDGLKKSKGCIEPAKRGDSRYAGLEKTFPNDFGQSFLEFVAHFNNYGRR